MPGFSIRKRSERRLVRQQNRSSETGRREASVTGDLVHYHKTHVFDRPKSVIAKMEAFIGCRISNSIDLLQLL